MKAKNQGNTNELLSETSISNSNNRNNNVVAGESPSCCKFPPKCIINMTDAMDKTNNYEQDLQMFEKRFESFFVIDKCLLKISPSTKSLSSNP